MDEILTSNYSNQPSIYIALVCALQTSGLSRLLNPNMVIQMCVMDWCFPVNAILFITLYTMVPVLDYPKSYYGVNWHKLK